MAAERAAAAGLQVALFERMPSPGRKLQIAGRGGLNLTHTEPLDRFLDRYGAAGAALSPAVRAFPPDALRAWCAELGQDTFVGSSGRVFPTAFKATPLLRAWLARLAGQGVRLRAGHRWLGWDAAGALHFAHAGGETLVRPVATVLALGGASWSRLGSDGAWVDLLRGRGVAVAALRERSVRLANLGYLGHMWELYAVWAWAPAYLTASLAARGESVTRSSVGLVVFVAFGLGGLAGCLVAGVLGDRIGRARAAAGAMVVSGSCCLLAALPLVVVFLFFQRQIIKGFATTGFGGQ